MSHLTFAACQRRRLGGGKGGPVPGNPASDRMLRDDSSARFRFHRLLGAIAPIIAYLNVTASAAGVAAQELNR